MSARGGHIGRRRLPRAGLQAPRRRVNIHVMPRCSAVQVSDNAEPQPRAPLAVWFGLTGLSVILLTLLAYRMTIGVDLSDESYYATFLDGWLKDGLATARTLCCTSRPPCCFFRPRNSIHGSLAANVV
jgi:hypothetical protein